tara:strand:- start:8123 stop:9373 length:1251 start_codon:yes stop_codon:yes gene_type:complete
MARYIFKLPDIGEGTAEAELVAWHVQVGDRVDEDQPVADVMTDKATVELTAPVAGRVAVLHGSVGEMAAIGGPLIEFETDEEAAAPDNEQSKVETPAPAPANAAQSTAAPVTASARPKRPKAAPAVRGRAKALGIALEDVQGTGPEGRIRQSDLDSHLANRQQSSAAPAPAARPVPAPAPALSGTEFEEVKLAGLRKRIAAKMELSTRQIPHFSYVEEIDVTELEQARENLNLRYSGTRPKLNLLPFLIRALCVVLPRYPQINAHYDEASATVRRYRPVHLGMATQTGNGLMVPVLRHAKQKNLWELADEILRLASAARDGTAKSEELSGSTITLTSLGRLGGIVHTPVINHPEVAIIGPNKIVERVMIEQGEMRVRKMMNLSSSFDHRVVDGHDAASFIQDIRLLLESPVALLAG